MVVYLRTLTNAFQDAGVPLLTGSDSPVIPGMHPGYSIHDDIHTLIDAGLTPYQALTAATRTPGEFVAKFVPTAAHFGTIAAGMRADLILLGANPLENVETLKSTRGVMTAGRRRSAMEMATIVDRRQQAYDALLK
jgi:imidazolonepropionase-like amidohydrolase